MGVWGRLAIIAIIANEVRGAFVAFATVRHLSEHGPSVALLDLAPLVVLPFVAGWLWKRWMKRRPRLPLRSPWPVSGARAET
jgi:hypothetical protein